MAAATCFYHPNQVSSTACSQCGIPLCSDCVQTVANRPVCAGCISAIRSRVGSEINSSASASPPQAQATGYTVPPQPQAPGQIPSSYAQGPAMRPMAAPVPTGLGGLLLGGVFGALIGIAGAFILAKIEINSHFEIGYLNSLVGFGCGYGVLLGCKRGGLIPAILGGVLAFFAMILAEFFCLQDAVVQYLSQHPGTVGNISPAMFVDYLMHIGIDWLFIAIGVYGGVRTPLRAAR